MQSAVRPWTCVVVLSLKTQVVAATADSVGSSRPITVPVVATTPKKRLVCIIVGSP